MSKPTQVFNIDEPGYEPVLVIKAHHVVQLADHLNSPEHTPEVGRTPDCCVQLMREWAPDATADDWRQALSTGLWGGLSE